MRSLFDLTSRSNTLIEAGFALAETALASRIVRHVFLGRGSFPEITSGAVAAARRRA
jgi:hypothetical protein